MSLTCSLVPIAKGHALRFKVGWLIPIAVLFTISFPPVQYVDT